MAKPTASDSGTNSSRAAPSMKNDGRKTARTQSMASKRGTAVSWLLRRAARATEGALARCVWMFSTSTVDMSTRMPTARARPPRVIRLIVWPVSQRREQRRQQGDGDVQDHHDHGAPIAQEQEHHQAGEDGPQQALPADFLDGLGHVGRLIELEAQVDVLRARPPSFAGKDALTSLTTDRVEASARLVTSMKTARRPLTRVCPLGMSVPSSILATSRR